jgi:hypothetical protein
MTMSVILAEAKDLASTADAFRAEARSFASLRMTLIRFAREKPR